MTYCYETEDIADTYQLPAAISKETPMDNLEEEAYVKGQTYLDVVQPVPYSTPLCPKFIYPMIAQLLWERDLKKE